ncbi:MAG: hypothetical protein K6A68_11815 [Clostridiales bacterium]|nr:hypothetical protein [Clostridiales bacterium]
MSADNNNTIQSADASDELMAVENAQAETSSPEQTPGKKTSNRSFLIALVVMIIAVGVTIAILMRNQHLNQDLSNLQTSLKESQNKWQEIAAEKEVLQEELETVENNIREAQLTYEESTEKIADLTQQVNDLTSQNTTLENQLVLASDAETMYTQQASAIRDTITLLQASNDSLVQELNISSDYTGDLWNTLVEARNQLLSSLKTKKTSIEAALASNNSRLASLPETGMESQASEIRSDIQALELQLTEVCQQIRMYGTEDDLTN